MPNRRRCLNCDHRFTTIEMTLEEIPDHAGSRMAISLKHLSGQIARTKQIVDKALMDIEPDA
jgi:transcriptional regulator NrdR family protein